MEEQEVKYYADEAENFVFEIINEDELSLAIKALELQGDFEVLHAVNIEDMTNFQLYDKEEVNDYIEAFKLSNDC